MVLLRSLRILGAYISDEFAPHLVEGLVRELRDVEVVERDLGVREALLDGPAIGLGHIHGHDLDPLARLGADLGKEGLEAGLVLALQPKAMDPNVRVAAELDELFVLSDGLPSVGDVVDPEHIQQSVATVNEASRIRINTIYVGGDEEEENRRTRGRGPRWDMDGPEFMRQLAEQNHGQFLHR